LMAIEETKINSHVESKAHSKVIQLLR